MAKIVKISDKKIFIEREEQSKLLKKKAEIKKLKSEIKKLNQLNESLSLSLDTIHNKYLESAQASVDILAELEYIKYKATFIDIDIKSLSVYSKIQKYMQLIKKFYQNELKCCYINIIYTGINEKIKKELTLKSKKKYKNMPGFLKDFCKIYYIELTDVMFPKRIIGRIILGREPYKDKRKEQNFEKKIIEELHEKIYSNN